MNIVLCEFIDEAQALMKRYGRDFMASSDVSVVCLHPKVRAYLMEQGIESAGTVNYLDNDAQHRITLKCEELVAKMIQEVSIKDEFGIEETYKQSMIHHLRLYINHFLWIIEILDGIRLKKEVQAIYCPMTKGGVAYTGKGYIQDRERFMGYLAEDFCRIHGIKFNPVLCRPVRTGLFSHLPAALARTIGGWIGKWNYRDQLKHREGSDKVYIVPALSYRMDTLVAEIKDREAEAKCFMVWDGKQSFKQEAYKVYLILLNRMKKVKKKNLIENVFNVEHLKGAYPANERIVAGAGAEVDHLADRIRKEYKNDCSYKGVAFDETFANKVRNGLKAEVDRVMRLTAALAGVFKALQPDVILSMYSIGVTHAMGELSRILGFESLNITHGTHVPPNNDYERIENYQLSTSVISNTYKYVAVQTPWANKFLDYYEDRRPKIMTGPLLFSVTDKSSRDQWRTEILEGNTKGKIVLHASTQKARNGLRFHITETLDEYIETLSDLVEAVNGLEDTWLVIRPHPVCNLSEGEFRGLLPGSDRIKIVQGGAFAPILSAADLLVSYSSTCIEEALQNKIPVLLYDRWSRYNHFNLKETTEAGPKVHQPVYYVTQKKPLAGCIDGILEEFDGIPLTEEELAEYRFPSSYRENFHNFVYECLNGTEKHEYSAYIG